MGYPRQDDLLFAESRGGSSAARAEALGEECRPPGDSGLLSHAFPALKRWAFLCSPARRPLGGTGVSRVRAGISGQLSVASCQ